MTTISKPLVASKPNQHLRPFDASRDLVAVADLVELCFADTLDADGRSYLQRMRSASRNASVLRWASLATEWASVPLAGYVWQQGESLVGNATMIPYYVKGKRFYLIANVAVHPDYRRRGIARQLTEQAIEHARHRGTSAIWLHVRHENEAALTLYGDLDFRERARRTTWFSIAEMPSETSIKGAHFTNPRSRDWNKMRAWLLRTYPPELSWHMPFNLNSLRPGLLGGFLRLLYNVYATQWALVSGSRILGAVTWQAATSHANPLWLAVPYKADEKVIYALLHHARHQAPSQRPLMLDYPAGVASEAIEAAGFKEHQTLIWMSLSLAESGRHANRSFTL